MTEICELCKKFSARLNANRRCCQVRLLAGMPKAQRQVHYNRLQAQEGTEALDALIEEVKVEYQRRVAAKTDVLGRHKK